MRAGNRCRSVGLIYLIAGVFNDDSAAIAGRRVDGGVHRERSWKQCDGTQVRRRSVSLARFIRARRTQKAFHFLPSALFIIALNRRVEKRGIEEAKRNGACACASLSFRRLAAAPQSLSLVSPSRSFSLLLPVAVSVAPCVTDACLSVASR